jgi:protein-tyrosine kinase
MSRIHEALKRAEQEAKSFASAETTPLPNVVEHVPFPELPNLRPEPLEHFAGVAVAHVPTRITDPEQWLTEIPCKQWKPVTEKLLFADPNDHYEPGMEQFRTLRSRLYQMRDKMPLKTIMISSALPGEGKSFVASNLAYAFVRQRGRRVLLIDGDVRKPHMHEFIGTHGTPGLNDYLAGDADERAIVQRGQQENLYFIAGGKCVSNPAELIANGRFKQLLEKLSPHFQWILVDSPPVIPIADGSMMAKYADGILLVVRAGSTAPEVVQRAKGDLKSAPILGVVLNRAEESKKLSSYYYSYSGIVPKKKGK